MIDTTLRKLTYGEQLRHPMWQRLRLERLQAAGWKCQACGGAETSLHVHHRRYIKGRMAWEYPAENFTVLCEPCHAEAHEMRDELMAILGTVDLRAERDILGLVAGFVLDKQATGWGQLNQRAANCGFLAGVLFDGRLSDKELLQLAVLVSDPDESLRESIAAIEVGTDSVQEVPAGGYAG